MPHYFLTTRNITRPSNKPPAFHDEPGEPSFVISSDAATTIDPADRIMGAGKRKKWAKAILDEAKNADDEGDIVFFVPGYNVNAQDAFTSHKTLSTNLKAQGLKDAVLVTYSWPAKGDFLNYLEDDSDARETAIHLVRSGIAIFAGMTEPQCRVRMHVMAHSMGAMVVREAFRAAAGNPHTRESAWGISQLIFLAADISARSLTSDVSQAMFDKSQRFTNYFNRHDTALATSNAKRFLSSPRLGRHGAPESVLGKVVDVDMSGRWEHVAANNAQGILRDKLLSHSFYKDDEKFARDVANTIIGDIDRRNMPDRQRHEGEPGRFMIV